MRVVFKERLDIKVQVFILFFCLTFIWLLSDYPWMSIVAGVFIYFMFGSRYYYIVFSDLDVKIRFPLLPFKSFDLKPEEIDVISHVLLYQGALGSYKDDLVQVESKKKRYQVSLYRDSDDFRKLNKLIHCETWAKKFRTKGDARDKEILIEKRDKLWNQ